MQGVWKKSRLLNQYILEMIQERAIVTIERQQELICILSNGAISISPQVTSNPDFKVTILFNVKWLENGSLQNRAILIIADQ